MFLFKDLARGTILKKLVLFCFLIFKTSLILSDEYLYPIVNLDNETILMMHQKSLDDLDLLSLNTKTNSTQKLLSSLYLPAHVKIIPGKTHYSFIDRGRIYIKDFSKRTPRVLDIYQPICDIQSLQWVSSHECVFSAKYKNHYKLFMYDISKDGGTLYTLCRLDDQINYIFPSIVDKDIFCLIQMDSYEFYNIGKLSWNPIIFEQSLSSQDQKNILEISPVQHANSLCFLHMKDRNSGYVLEIVEHNHESKLFTFGCCKIDLTTNQMSRLFEFKIPEDFIIGIEDVRFFESLYPLLPYYNQHEIYFTSYDQESDKLKLYLFNQHSQEIFLHPITKGIENKHIFAPLLVNDFLYFGKEV